MSYININYTNIFLIKHFPLPKLYIFIFAICFLFYDLINQNCFIFVVIFFVSINRFSYSTKER